MSDRIDALSYHLERVFGAKVPQCPRCHGEKFWENYVRACWHCETCGYDITGEAMTWVPKDERARRPEEFAADDERRHA